MDFRFLVTSQQRGALCRVQDKATSQPSRAYSGYDGDANELKKEESPTEDRETPTRGVASAAEVRILTRLKERGTRHPQISKVVRIS